MRDRRALWFAHLIVTIGLVLVCGAAIGGSLPELTLGSPARSFQARIS